MAVTREQLEIAVQVNAKQATTDTNALGDSFFRLRDAAGKFATPAQAKLYREIQQTRAGLDAQAAAGKDVSKEYAVLEKRSAALGLALQGAETPLNGVAGQLQRIDQSLNSTMTSVSQFRETISGLITVVEYLTDPRKIRMLSNMMFLLGSGLDLKGFDKSGEKIKQLSQGLDQYNDALADSELANMSVTEKLESMANSMRTVQDMQDGIKLGLEQATVAFVAFTLKNAGAHTALMRGMESTWKATKVTATALNTLSLEAGKVGKEIRLLLPAAGGALVKSVGRDVALLGNSLRETFSVLIVQAYKYQETLTTITLNANYTVNSIQQAYRTVEGFRVTRITFIRDDFQRAAKEAEIFGKATKDAAARMRMAWSGTQNSSKQAVTGIAGVTDAFKRLQAAVVDEKPWQLFKTEASKAFDVIKSLFATLPGVFAAIGGALAKGGTFKNVRDSLGDVFKAFKQGFSAGSFSTAFTDIGKAASTAGKTIFSDFSQVVKNIPDATGKTANSLVDLGFKMKQTVKDAKAFTGSLLHAGPGVIALTETMTMLTPGLVGLATLLMQSSNGFIKFAGTITLIGAILMGGFVYAVKTAMVYVGGFVEKIGDALMQSMATFEEKFVKAQVAVENFVFTLKGMQREYGDSVGSLEGWNALISELDQSTIWATADLQKMVTEIVQVGTSLGLTKDQMESLARLIPDHAKAGDDLFDVTVAFVQALNGMGQGVVKYGLHVNDAAVEHTKFAKELGLVVATMTDEQKAQARLAAMLEKSAPVRGKAALQMDTMAGASLGLTKAMDRLKIGLGEQGFFTQAYYVTLTKLAKVMADLPKPVLDAAGALQDLAGITFKVTGMVLGSVLTIAFSIGVWKALAGAVATNVTVQNLLTKAMMIATGAMGVQGVAVTSMATLFRNFAILMKGVVLSTLVALKDIFISLIAGIGNLTKALLLNPLFWKAAAIVAGIYLVVRALKQIDEQTGVFTDSLDGMKAAFSSLGSVFSSTGASSKLLGTILRETLGRAIDAMVLAVGILINGLLGVQVGVAELLKGLVFFSSTATKAIDDFNKGTFEMINKISEAMGDAGSRIFTFSEAAYAAGDSAKGWKDGLADVLKNLRDLKKELISGTETELIQSQVFGSPSQTLMLSKKLNEENLAKVKEIDEKKSILKELMRIDAEIIKTSRDAVKESDNQLRELKIKELERANNLHSVRQAAKMRLTSEVEPLNEKIKDLSFLPSTDEVKTAIEKTNALIKAKTVEVMRDVKEKVKSLTRERVDLESDVRTSLARFRQQDTEVVGLETQKQIEAYRRMMEDKKISLEQFSALQRGIYAQEARSLQDIADRRFAAGTNIERLAGNDLAVMAREAEASIEDLRKSFNKGDIGEEQFTQAIRAISKNMLREQDRLVISQRKEAADLARNELALFKFEQSERLDLLHEFHEKGRISEIEHLQAVAKVNKEYAEKVQSYWIAKFDVSGWLNAIQGGISNLISKIGDMFGPIGKEVANIINFFNQPPKAFGEMIDNLINDIIRLPENLLTNIPMMLEKLVGALPSLISSTLENAFTFLPKLTVKLITALVRAIPKVLMEILNPRFWLGIGVNMLKGIGSVFSDLLGAIGFNFAGVGDAAEEAAKSVAKSITSVADQTFAVMDVTNGNTGLGAAISDAFEQGKNILDQAWEALKQAARWVGSLFVSTWEGLKAAGSFVWSLLVTTWEWFKATGSFVGSIIGSAWDGLKAVGGWLWDTIFAPLKTLIFQPIVDLLTGAFTTITDGIGKVFAKMGDIGGKIWDGFLDALNSGLSGIKNLFLKMFDASGAFPAPGDIEKVLGINVPFITFSEGGVVPGRAKFPGNSLMNDTIPALLSPGEVVLSREMLDNPQIKELMKMLGFPGKAVGGAQKKPYTQNFASGTWETIKQTPIVKKIGEKGGEVFNKASPLPTSLDGVFGFGMFQPMFELMGRFVETLSQLVGWVEVKIKEVVNTLWGWVTEWTTGKEKKVFNEKVEIAKVGEYLGEFIRNDLQKYVSMSVKDVLHGAIFNGFAANKFASGGFVPGVGTGDTVPAMLTPGEFVLNRSAVQNLGGGLLNRLNSGQAPISQNVEINLTINTEQPIDEAFIKGKILPTIQDAMRRSSLDGRRILAPSGVR